MLIGAKIAERTVPCHMSAGASAREIIAHVSCQYTVAPSNYYHDCDRDCDRDCDCVTEAMTMNVAMPATHG